jgi:hypothetical protein
VANACALAFESMRVDTAPDLAALQVAAYHAREACRLDPSSGEAWSTLGFVLHRSGEGREAIAPRGTPRRSSQTSGAIICGSRP